MSDIDAVVTLSKRDEQAKTGAMIGYGLMVLGMGTGIFWIIGAIWAMVKKREAAGTLFEDHYANIISTFWWGMVFTLIGFILMFVMIGYVVLFALWFWSLFRMIRGLARLTSNKGYYSL